ncbi:hypothetical protein [Amycolatopsis rubida]|uniref:hypothetical protein n=1 Tax=Amycolatopsis rubida TaxID=112413 RepID=UPI00142F2B35|nr:hypothetical protein [Amycolatopsis rubida]
MFNEGHQLDHLPENLRLPGVAHGDRWAWTGDGAPPYEQSVAGWRKRGLLTPGVRRPLLAFFTPVLGYVAPRSGCPGRIADCTSRSPSWPNRTAARRTRSSRGRTGPGFPTCRPADLPGRRRCLDPTLDIGSGAGRTPGSLLYLDEDPVEVSRAIAERVLPSIVPWRDW